jgi:hypothetical protein
LSQKDKFLKVSWIVFKYLYLVMLGVLLFRTAFMVYHDGWDFLEVGNVVLGIVIATVGIAFVSALITWAALSKE